jgi:uncharacterized protein (TIGR03435 family)
MKWTAATCALPLLALGWVAFGEDAETPRFLAADVHVSPKTQNQGMRPPSGRGERYEVRNATMVDLIVLAYGFNATRILGGPSWLEMDRFDVIAKAPPQTAPDVQKSMLKNLLAERFKLVVRQESKPMPAYTLTLGPKKPQLKEADGSGEAGCKPQSSNAAPGQQGVIRLTTSAGAGGPPLQLTLVDGMIEFKCRNMTMAAFVEGLRGMLGANLGQNPVLDQTGLSGVWNFDLKYSLGLIGPTGPVGERLTVQEAVEKQLGLKMEEKPIPTDVLTVESVNQKPTANPPETAAELPSTATPTEFEVATIKPTDPDFKGGRLQMQPGGRFVSEGLPLQFLITRAFNTNSNDQISGIPSWANSTRFDVMAKAPGDTLTNGIDPDTLAPMMLALLKERFKLAYHAEEKELQGYSLVAAKPRSATESEKMTKADPSSRTWCKAPGQIPGAPLAPQGMQALICQNITMAQFADLIRSRTAGIDGPVVDMTGLEGSWDFRLTFSPFASMNLPAPVRSPEGGQAGNPGLAAASDPGISGVSVFDAVEKQLGLKLVKQKRPGQVFVIDHIDQTPSEN